MKVKLVGCLVLSSIIIALAVALPIVFLLNPDSPEESDPNPTVDYNSTSTIQTYYSTPLHLSRSAQLPVLSTIYELPTKTSSTILSTTTIFPTETPIPGRKKPWWHWW